jgi:hypothetical protein
MTNRLRQGCMPGSCASNILLYLYPIWVELDHNNNYISIEINHNQVWKKLNF